MIECLLTSFHHLSFLLPIHTQATTAAAQSAEAAGSSAKVAVGSTGSSRVGPGTGIGIQGNLRFVNSWAAMQHLYRLPQVKKKGGKEERKSRKCLHSLPKLVFIARPP